MLNITPICKHYGKLGTQFRDNKMIMAIPEYENIKVTMGPGGKTEIPDELIPEFFLCLSDNTRQQILDGVKWPDIKWKRDPLPTPLSP